MRILVTRPEPDGERSAATLRARGHDVMLAPLLRIELVADAAVRAADRNISWDAIALTSINAVRAVAALPSLAPLLPLPAFTVGRRTAEAALAAGFANVACAQGDVGDLARMIRTHLRGGARILHLAGAERAGDLTGVLARDGIAVTTVELYRAVTATRLPEPVRVALAGRRLDAVLHYSPRTAAAFLACAAADGVAEPALALAHYCLSAKVAAPLREAGAARVRVASRPTEADLLALIGT